MLGLTLLPLSQTAQARSLSEVLKSGKIVIATDPPYKPFFYEEGGKLTGFEVELGEELARRLGVKVEWKYNKFDTLLIGLSQNRYDMVIASHGITPERLRAVDFSAPDYCSGGTILTTTNGPATAAALKGKAIGVAGGTTYSKIASGVQGAQVKTFPSTTAALQALTARKVDAILVDQFFAYEMKDSAHGKMLKVGQRLTTERVGFAIQKGKASLTGAVNPQMKKMTEDGTYLKLSQKYFGRDVRCK
ncbi:ABC transporter substrate-binding protein [Deinococcus wulumuqiensis]|uniref:ABC transporter substrate-binding protein n=2 Tax=Deinococcus wulumuqiensis TaxID=980427 RepID=UPI00242DA984|nr:ABC transporter substrate-binding protein [Deinococcus wulumuqiensis]